MAFYLVLVLKKADNIPKFHKNIVSLES
ncbi:MAG: hypothetical protein IKG99_05825 [Bacteroidaceae bacterium]|nr:hypothetical protein [Bacteroidaceae bacterium]